MRLRQVLVSPMNKLSLSPEAAIDLADIKQYISYELKNPTAAQRVVRGITKELRVLERYAEAGPSVAALTGYPSDLRILVCGKHIAIYKVIGDTILVSRIINAKQDYITILFGEELTT